MERTAWHIAGDEEPGSTTGFHSGEFIQATGKLESSRIRAFQLGKAATVTFALIDVYIHPATLEDLQATSTEEAFSIRENDDRPHDGRLAGERGRIRFFEADEYGADASLSARLWLDQATFDALVQKIREGRNMRTVRLEILADLFRFGHGDGVGYPWAKQDYGLMCSNDGHMTKGSAHARLEELRIEWSPTLDDAKARNDPDEPPLDAQVDKGNAEAAARQIADDVKNMRSRLDAFFQVAIFIAVLLVFGRILDWFGQ